MCKPAQRKMPSVDKLATALGDLRARGHDFVVVTSHDQLDLPDDELSRRCEQTIRNYDPCISCATHFLRLEIDRLQSA